MAETTATSKKVQALALIREANEMTDAYVTQYDKDQTITAKAYKAGLDLKALILKHEGDLGVKIKVGDEEFTLDTLANNHIASVRKLRQKINQHRKPFTDKLNAIIKLWTTLEGVLDESKDQAVVKELSKMRSEYLRKMEVKRQQEEREKQRQQHKTQERIDAKAEVKAMYMDAYVKYLRERREELQDIADAMTTKTYDESFAKIKEFVSVIRVKTLRELPIDFPVLVHNGSSADKEAIMAEAATEVHNKVAKGYEEVIKKEREKLLLEMPGRLQFVKKKEAADADKKKEMEEQERNLRAKRKKEADEAEERERQRRMSQVESDRASEAAQKLFDQDSQVQEQEEETKGKKLSKVAIEILEPAAYYEIFQFYMDHEGLKTPGDKLQRKTLGQMVKFAEKKCKETGEQIDSDYLTYHTEYKAVST